jgi:hypothetical protein
MICAAEISGETSAPADQAAAALARCGVLGRRLGPSSWEITLPSDQVCTGRVRIEDGMLRLDAPLVGPQWPLESLWGILPRNGWSGPGVRLGLSTAKRIVLIGEIVIEHVLDVDDRIGRLLADMTALDRQQKDEAADMAIDADAAIDPAALCEEAGWEYTRRDDAVVVRLEANRYGTGLQAAAIPFSAVIRIRSGILHCMAELVRDDAPPPEPNAAAIAALLLRVATQIRLVRPAAVVDGQSLLVFESLLPSASAWELGQALSAMSIAARLCGPETAALSRNADLAREFLRIRFPGFVGPAGS